MGRAEAFAMKHGPIPSLFDGLGNAAGYSLVLVLVGATRELFGAGSLMGVPVLPLEAQRGWYVPNGLMVLGPGAFFVMAGLIWALRTFKPAQVERDAQVDLGVEPARVPTLADHPGDGLEPAE